MDAQELLKEIDTRINSKKAAMEICSHIPEKVMALQAEIDELLSLQAWATTYK